MKINYVFRGANVDATRSRPSSPHALPPLLFQSTHGFFTFRSKGMCLLSSCSSVQLANPELYRQKAYVNSEWISASSTFSICDPVNNKEIGTCPDMTREQVSTAIDHAYTAFSTFRKTSHRERATFLKKLYDLCIKNKDDLAKIITWENGKPLAEAKGEVDYGASFIQWFSEEAVRTYGKVIPSSTASNRIMSIQQPIGVTPFNFPIAMATRKFAAAIAAGCTVVWRPGNDVPFTALAVAQLAHEAGIPKGVFNVITTHENTKLVGEELCTNPKIKKISFTGSTNVGKLFMKQCSSTMKKVSFELGGNAPFIVFDDADLDKAINGAIVSKFRGSGQTCICANRIYVQEGIYSEFVKKFSAKVAAFQPGSGFAQDTTHGPLIHSRALEKIQELMKDAMSKGAKIEQGGKELPDLGPNFYAPTVLSNVTKDMKFAREEIFGPLAPIFRFKTEKEVIELANDTDVGLAGYFYSQDISRVWRVAEALEVGMVGVNTGAISDAAMPFGGVKESGLGREGGYCGLDEYLQIKAITMGGLA
ncbi:Glutarate-semialdehyde dehydrogenase DavD [Neolecta irregularis DAH-3]|uniref:Succinate-semialdehyde dehydrogenase n=1 Tax=Neolecta irregularis (strain DAH-3) TaxID=1198029 RepID=A0A1U7LG58_NEOID|nr:Glutarate-semialdehyde dehydrogenase DavD [Neolecta irregularis DAH-3]|eukprot:OLL21629.1 Glutarate-semialdehyde dehydrogenase DavD [Neolecta irregularis DAH-3]